MKPLPAKDRQAFSLIELLTVISIIVLLATICAGALNNVLRSSQLNNAAEILGDGLNQARVIAVSHNCNTEFRVISTSSTTAPNYVQTMLVENDGTIVAQTKPQQLPQGVVVATNPSHSGVMNLTVQTIPSGQPLAGASYRSIRFSGKGEPRDISGAALTGTNDFLTVVTAQLYTAAQLPADWVSFRLDDRTGAANRFQP